MDAELCLALAATARAGRGLPTHLGPAGREVMRYPERRHGAGSRDGAPDRRRPAIRADAAHPDRRRLGPELLVAAARGWSSLE